MNRLRTGIGGLDVMLNGGIPQGKSVLISGHCGAGKTIFGLHFIQQGFRQGENCVLFTFEQSKRKLLEDAKAVGIDLATMEKSGRLRIVGDSFANLRVFKDKARARINDLIDEIEEVVKESEATRVVIDSVNLFTMLFDTDAERRLGLASVIIALERHDCTTLLTCEVPEKSDRYGWFGFEEFMVDGVVTLHRLVADGETERSIMVIKMRGSAHNQGIRAMQITDGGIVVYPDQEPPSVRLASPGARR